MKYSLFISNTTMKLTSYENSIKFKGLQYQLRFKVIKGMKILLSPIYELLHEILKNNMPKKFFEYIRKAFFCSVDHIL